MHAGAAVGIWCRLLCAVLYCVDCADVITNPAAVDTLLPCVLGWELWCLPAGNLITALVRSVGESLFS